MITEAISAYVAGLIDGEGSIVIDVAWCASGSPCHSLRVSICSTSRLLIDWLLGVYGGSASNDTRSSIKRGRRPCWAWRLSAARAQHFLESVYPYLIEKKRQASLAVEFQKQKDRKRASRPLSQQVITEREWYRQEISRLNLNGKAHRSPAATRLDRTKAPADDDAAKETLVLVQNKNS
jgi:hypothetical protein